MMLIAGGRGSGKTTEMVEWLRANPDGVLVVLSEREADRIAAMPVWSDEERRSIRERCLTLYGIRTQGDWPEWLGGLDRRPGVDWRGRVAD